MVQWIPFKREVICKIVYYGPGLSGKTTNLQVIHQKVPKTNKGELVTISTEQDRTLFFDFMPMDIGEIAGMKVKLKLFTVPGQVYYNSTRKVVLQNVDGIVFVADSQRHKLQENKESLQNLKENLLEYKRDICDIPLIIQWNKRDMKNVFAVEKLDAEINIYNVPTYKAVATKGTGVFATLKKCIAEVLHYVQQDMQTENTPKEISSCASQAPSAVTKLKPQSAKPATSKAKPATSKAKPATSKAKPATSKAKPATSKAKPATSKAKPATSKTKSQTTKSKAKYKVKSKKL